MAETDDEASWFDDVPPVIKRAGEIVEREIGCTLKYDGKIAHEIEERLSITLQAYNLERPNITKTAGHLSFWMRKLKPFEVFRPSETLKALVAGGYLDSDKIEEVEDPKETGALLFVNEFASVILAIGLLRGAGSEVMPSDIFQSDLCAALRYNSFSPNSLALVFEALIQAELQNGSSLA